MAADKLCILRKDKCRYDVFLMAKDLKVFNKDKRDQFLLNYDQTEQDERYLEQDAAQESDHYNQEEIYDVADGTEKAYSRNDLMLD